MVGMVGLHKQKVQFYYTIGLNLIYFIAADKIYLSSETLSSEKIHREDVDPVDLHGWAVGIGCIEDGSYGFSQLPQLTSVDGIGSLSPAWCVISEKNSTGRGRCRTKLFQTQELKETVGHLVFAPQYLTDSIPANYPTNNSIPAGGHFCAPNPPLFYCPV